MTQLELQTLANHLSNASNYLEFGAGNSTLIACANLSLQKILSVESSSKFIDELRHDNDVIKLSENQGRLEFFIANIGETSTWGMPIDNSRYHLWPNYSLGPFNNRSNFDLILIDGRFRVACALASIATLHSKPTILFHDFWTRKKYHVLLPFFQVQDQIDSMAVLRPKDNFDYWNAQKMLKRYSFIPDDTVRRSRTVRFFTKAFGLG